MVVRDLCSDCDLTVGGACVLNCGEFEANEVGIRRRVAGVRSYDSLGTYYTTQMMLLWPQLL
jgi:hypothetical protein